MLLSLHTTDIKGNLPSSASFFSLKAITREEAERLISQNLPIAMATNEPTLSNPQLKFLEEKIEKLTSTILFLREKLSKDPPFESRNRLSILRPGTFHFNRLRVTPSFTKEEKAAAGRSLDIGAPRTQLRIGSPKIKGKGIKSIHCRSGYNEVGGRAD